MYTAKVCLIVATIVAGVALAQAAGGIKGQRAEDSSSRASGLKGPRPQQQYLPPPPPPQQQPQPLPQAPRPAAVQPIKGPGQVAPNFNAIRVRPAQQQQLALPQPAFRPVQQQVQQQQIQIQQQEQEPEQQQQQEAEIDPNAAAQDSSPSLIAPAPTQAQAAAASAASEEEANPKPEPYSFNYSFESGDSATSGSSQREETQDASGKVTGFYTLKGEDGRDRRVDYVADASGFRATISTNEMGTADKDSADVDWQAQAASDAQLRVAESATQAARQRALQNPQPLSSSSSQSKITSPRQNVASQQQLSFAASKTQQKIAEPLAQLQEPFEQIRQTELNARARKSRHAPFYLFTI